MDSSRDMSADVFSAMQTDKPHAVYKKTILGKVFVTVLNPFDESPEGILLQGNPRWLYQIITNLVNNAIDACSKENSIITIKDIAKINRATPPILGIGRVWAVRTPGRSIALIIQASLITIGVIMIARKAEPRYTNK